MELNYRINSIDEISFSLNYDFPYEGIDKNKINYQFSHEIKLNHENSEVVIGLNIFFTYGEKEEKLYSQSVRSSFEVIPFASFVSDDDGGCIHVSEPLLIDTFLNVTIGAARGMISKNTKGTPLSDCVLPLVPMSLIRNAAKK